MKNSVQLPELIFESGWLLDASVSEIAGKTLNEDAVGEISERLAEFEKAWLEIGRPLLSHVCNSFQLRFAEKDIKVFLICGSLYSQSHPLLVNVKYYLQALREAPSPLHEFAESVLHETLHILLQDNISTWPTPVIAELESEDLEVTTHLHLMALHRFAHHSSNATDPANRITELGAWYATMGENYQRAWEMSGERELYPRLLQEVRAYFGALREPNFFRNFCDDHVTSCEST